MVNNCRGNQFCGPSADQVWTKWRPSKGGPNLGPPTAWSPLGPRLVWTWSASTTWSSFCHAHPIHKMHVTISKRVVTHQFGKSCSWHDIYNLWIQFTNWIWCLNSKRTCMFMSQCAHCIAHAVMRDVRRTMPECTRGACMQCIVRWGVCLCTCVHLLSSCPHWSPYYMHIQYMCLCLKCEGARCESNSPKCVWHFKCTVDSNSFIVI